MKTLFDKKYSDESLIDLDQDVFEAIEVAALPKDEYNFTPGTFRVVITWEDDNEPQ